MERGSDRRERRDAKRFLWRRADVLAPHVAHLPPRMLELPCRRLGVTQVPRMRLGVARSPAGSPHGTPKAAPRW
jgi:hypothetical protein